MFLLKNAQNNVSRFDAVVSLLIIRPKHLSFLPFGCNLWRDLARPSWCLLPKGSTTKDVLCSDHFTNRSFEDIFHSSHDFLVSHSSHFLFWEKKSKRKNQNMVKRENSRKMICISASNFHHTKRQQVVHDFLSSHQDYQIPSKKILTAVSPCANVPNICGFLFFFFNKPSVSCWTEGN